MKTKELTRTALLLMMTLALGCSKVTENDRETASQQMSDPASQQDAANVAVPTMLCHFRGVWSVNDVPADTVDVTVSVGDRSYNPKGSHYVCFYGFPFREMTKRIAPDTKVEKITTDMLVGVPLPPDQALQLQTIIDHGDNYNCIEKCIAQDMRCIGASQSAIYLELMPGMNYAVRYLPWVVTDDKGELQAITAVVVPTLSQATLSANGDSFSCVLTIKEAEIGKAVMTMQPEMKLTFTSIKRVERASLGN